MRGKLLKCKECHFWLPYVERDLKLSPDISDIGVCIKPGADNWFKRKHKDDSCGQGELKKEDILPPKT